MSKKKILFITGEFLPYTQSVGGVIRLVSFIRTLNKFDITILCSKGKYFGYFGFEKYLKNVKTIFVNSHGNKLINNENIILRILRTLFSNIFYLFAFDSKFILVNSYKLKLKNILNNSKPDCIILSGPPFSLFKLALFIKSYLARAS